MWPVLLSRQTLAGEENAIEQRARPCSARASPAEPPGRAIRDLGEAVKKGTSGQTVVRRLARFRFGLLLERRMESLPKFPLGRSLSRGRSRQPSRGGFGCDETCNSFCSCFVVVDDVVTMRRPALARTGRGRGGGGLQLCCWVLAYRGSRLKVETFIELVPSLSFYFFTVSREENYET